MERTIHMSNSNKPTAKELMSALDRINGTVLVATSKPGNDNFDEGYYKRDYDKLREHFWNLWRDEELVANESKFKVGDKVVLKARGSGCDIGDIGFIKAVMNGYCSVVVPMVGTILALNENLALITRDKP